MVNRIDPASSTLCLCVFASLRESQLPPVNSNGRRRDSKRELQTNSKNREGKSGSATLLVSSLGCLGDLPRVARKADRFRRQRFPDFIQDAETGDAQVWIPGKTSALFGYRLAAASANRGIHYLFPFSSTHSCSSSKSRSIYSQAIHRL